MLQLESIEIWKERPNYGIDPAYRAGTSVIGGVPEVAIQQKLGLRAKRRTGLAADYCAHSVVARSVLTWDVPLAYRIQTMHPLIYSPTLRGKGVGRGIAGALQPDSTFFLRTDTTTCVPI